MPEWVRFGVACVTMMKLTIFCNSIFQSSSSPLNENLHNVLVIDFYNTFIAMKIYYLFCVNDPSFNPLESCTMLSQFSHFFNVSIAFHVLFSRIFHSSHAKRFQKFIQHYLVYSFAQPLNVSCRSWFRHCCLVHCEFCNLPYDIISSSARHGVLSS